MAESLLPALGDEVRDALLCQILGIGAAGLLLRGRGRARPGRRTGLVVEDDEREGHRDFDVLGPPDPYREPARLGCVDGPESESPVHLLSREREAAPGLEHAWADRHDDVVIEVAGIDP